MKSKPITSLSKHDDKGAFIRAESYFRNFISGTDSVYKPEKDRYHLYIAYACPWANRTLLARNMKGLQDVIGLSIVHPTWQVTKPEDPEDEHKGWVFRKPTDSPLSNTKGYGSIPCDGCVEDYVNHCRTVRELYEKCLPEGITTVYSVPVLWDKKTGTIVNNESSEICEMFNDSFQDLAKCPNVDLYPKDKKNEIDELNEWIYNDITNGVYKCLAKSQEVYDIAVNRLFDALERVEAILSKQKYMVGDQLTIIDIRLFVTLIRFEEVYFVYFKTNKKSITQYPSIMRLLKDLYSIPAIKSTINMEHIKRAYYTSHDILNPYAIIPVGNNFLKLLA